MKTMNNFTISKKEINDASIAVFTDENGNDWYDSQKEFADDTLKIMFDASGVIVAASYDVSMLAPGGLSVAEIAPAGVPDDFSLPGSGRRWVFDGTAITERVSTPAELAEQAEQRRADKIAAATVIIAPLQDAVELGRASAGEKERLIAWKNYRVDLNQLDISVPSEIVWPVAPDVA